MKQIIKKNGLPGLWKGLFASLSITPLSSGLWWFSFGFLKNNLFSNTPTKIEDAFGFNSILQNAICGAISGCVTVTVLNPLDVSKTHIQTQKAKANIFSIFSTCFKIAKVEGWKVLWIKGLTPRLTSVTIHSITNSVSYELFKTLSYEKKR